MTDRQLFPTSAVLLALALAAGPAVADGEREAVERAVLDYVEAIEQARPELIERGVHPDLVKIGFYREGEGADYRLTPMTFDELVELAATFKEKGYVPENPEHTIDSIDVLDQTASARLSAFWGIDRLHLAKFDGEWKIVQVLWQSYPPE
ncbi:MAG: nuclear transport factor 2 family protein [Thermoanaerobaculia bacterium]|nr:nuclear transport factor 2 family protein [Thermoanaerobaculia bacterium]